MARKTAKKPSIRDLLDSQYAISALFDRLSRFIKDQQAYLHELWTLRDLARYILPALIVISAVMLLAAPFTVYGELGRFDLNIFTAPLLIVSFPAWILAAVGLALSAFLTRGVYAAARWGYLRLFGGTGEISQQFAQDYATYLTFGLVRVIGGVIVAGSIMLGAIPLAILVLALLLANEIANWVYYVRGNSIIHTMPIGKTFLVLALPVVATAIALGLLVAFVAVVFGTLLYTLLPA